jgi:catechol 2,3-dioxygenase-like lactoylglutathione lyase family enzyme
VASGTIKALGEIALRVNDLDAMQAFYQDVIGLELMRRFPDSAFFKIADGYGGHTQILALFDRRSQSGYTGLSAAQTTVDHLAFTIAREDFEAERTRLEGLGCKLTFANHDWVHWRSLYVNDPEGNNVEFVCYDPTV